MWKRLTAGLLSLLLLVPAASAAFSDVPEGAWYADAVNEMAADGFLQGMGDGTFDPDRLVSRGMVAVLLWRLQGEPRWAEVKTPLADVAGNAWYREAAAWAAEAGIVTGDENGNFRGEDPVNRQELATFLYRYSQATGLEICYGPLVSYADEYSLPCWAIPGMRHAVGAGLITGTPDNRLDPTGSVSRAHLAVVMRRLITRADG